MKYLPRVLGGVLGLMLLLCSAPVSAQSSDESSSRLIAYTSYRTSSYGRISSSLSRKIRALDEDPVENLSIPVAFSVSTKQLSRNFGDARDGGARSHEGLDIMAAKGTPVASPTDAVVTSTGTGESAGKYVYTANPGGERFVYMHLDAIKVKSGDVLKPGALIGLVGNTGNASGGAPHLHFEIREGRKAIDPYPRLTKEFTTKERIELLEKTIKDADDEEAEAQKVVASYRPLLMAARASGVTLSDYLNEALSVGSPAGSLLAGSPLFARDLALGARGDDVAALQSFLIGSDSGPVARELLDAGATGYFGPVTERALVEYQAAQGIAPAAGYFGPLTRARILSVI